MTDPLAGQDVLVTGGTGTFGHAFLAHALTTSVRRVVILSRDELKQAQMAAAFPDPRVRYLIGDVRDRERIRRALRGITIVLHAAAMKRIETCEAEPIEAVATNVTGTLNVALEAVAAGVRRAVFLSTDKAPGAHTLYGMTKAVAERVWSRANVYAAGTRTRLAATRYGNVLGSRGSVLGLFQQQRAAGLPLTLTDEAMTRFWMPPTAAVEIVLTALRDMRGGEVFVPKIGSCPTLTLARAVAERTEGETYAPGHLVTGVRPGERLHETLISHEEARTTRECGTHYVVLPESRPWEDTQYAIPGHPVAPEWSYRSDTNPHQLTTTELRAMIAC